MIQATDVVTASVWWARHTIDDSPNHHATGGDIQFRPLDSERPAGLAYSLVKVPAFSIPSTDPIDHLEDWTYQESESLATRLDDFAGQSGWIEIVKPLGMSDHTLALDEIQLYINGEPVWTNDTFFDLTVTDSAGQTVDALALNSDGWPATNAATGAVANPITVTMTITNITDTPATHVSRLTLGKEDGSARFYVFDQPDHPLCLPTAGAFSNTLFVDQCRNVLHPDETIVLTWRIWIQPSADDTLPITAELLEDLDPIVTRTHTVDIPQAAIHPVVFIHGILGSMPPDDKLITSHNAARERFDPFLGTYWPLLDTFEKIGYEWDKSLFGISYDWRQSNTLSAGFLADQLNTAIIPRSRPAAVPYMDSNPQADLVVHSMGGLVSRSYIQGMGLTHSDASVAYQDNVRKVVFIASPHKGFAFDYQTWEGMTWSRYLENAPLWSGGRLWRSVNTLRFLMDNRIWPRLAVKKYQPTFTELQDNCIPTLEQVLGGYAYYAGWSCSRPVYASWAHDIDPADPTNGKGVRSLFEMLPAEDFAIATPYLTNNDGRPAAVPPGNYPYGRQQNTFLQDLNAPASIDRLRTVLGDPTLTDNIYVLFGDGINTHVSYEVWKNSPDIWRNGEVGWSSTREDPNGDDLITRDSTTLLRNGLLPGIPLVNEQPLDAVLGATHKEIMFYGLTQRTWLPQFLGVIGNGTPSDTISLPFDTRYAPPDALTNLGGSTIVFMTGSPIDLLITDPQGRRLGYDPVTDQVFNEIPNTLYTSTGTSPQLVIVPQPIDGDYEVMATGYGAGTYDVTIDYVDSRGIVPLEAHTGTTTAGQQNTYTYTHDTASIPAPSLTPARYEKHHDLDIDMYTTNLTLADVNNDGIDDLIEGVNTHINVALGRGDGLFYYQTAYGDRGGQFTVADFNGDDQLDIATAQGGMLLGDGNGSFSTATPFTNTNYTAIYSGDFNGDTKQDLLIPSYNSSQQQREIRILLGQGNGTFQAAQTTSFDTTYGIKDAVVADFNGDMQDDVAFISHRTMGVFLSASNGTFQSLDEYGTSEENYDVVVGDFNRDNQVDIAVASWYPPIVNHPGGNNVDIFLNTGDGTFEDVVSYPVGGRPVSLTTADLNNDGMLDIVTGNIFDTMSIILGYGDGTFQEATNLPSDGGDEVSINAGYFDEDTYLDLIIAGSHAGSTRILLSLPPTDTYPAAEVLDAFNRADGAPGANWEGSSLTTSITDNQLALNGEGALLWDTAFEPTQEASITFAQSIHPFNELGITLKSQGDGNCDAIKVVFSMTGPHGPDTIRVYTCHANGSWIQQGLDIRTDFVQGDRLGARVDAHGFVEVYQNETLLTHIGIDADWPYRDQSGQIGIWADTYDQDVIIDNFVGGDMQR